MARTGSSGKDLGLCLSVASASATPTLASSPAATDAASMPTDGISLPSGGGSGAADGSGGGAAAAAGGAQVQAHEGTNTANAINVEDDVVPQDGPLAKRQKKCTSDV